MCASRSAGPSVHAWRGKLEGLIDAAPPKLRVSCESARATWVATDGHGRRHLKGGDRKVGRLSSPSEPMRLVGD
eukprot:1880089-Alexandrium_andersonii.AAC.1